MREYIMFVLGANNNDISTLIRKRVADTDDLWKGFEICEYIVDKFIDFDKQYSDTMSELCSFYKFVCEYHDELVSFINNDVEFDLRKE